VVSATTAEAFPEAGPYRYVILDRNSKFRADVIQFSEINRPAAEAHKCPDTLAKTGSRNVGSEVATGSFSLM